jgi:hypothetical protein
MKTPPPRKAHAFDLIARAAPDLPRAIPELPPHLASLSSEGPEFGIESKSSRDRHAASYRRRHVLPRAVGWLMSCLRLASSFGPFLDNDREFGRPHKLQYAERFYYIDRRPTKSKAEEYVEKNAVSI